MKKETSHSKGRSMFISILRIMLMVIIFQSAVTLSAIFISGTFTSLDTLAIQAFDDKNSSHANFMNIDFNNRWMNIEDVYANTNDTIDTIIKSSGHTYDDLLNSDVALNTLVINNLAEHLVTTITAKAATGAFVAFGRPQEETDKYGLYIRDTNYLLSSPNLGDCYLEVAPYSYQSSYNIIQSSDLNYKFQYLNYNSNQRAIFDRPMLAYNANPNSNFLDCGWWSSPGLLNSQHVPVITFTVPLINSEKQVYGVFGLEVSVKYLVDFLPYVELDSQNRGYYLLAKGNADLKFTLGEAIISGINQGDIKEFFGKNPSEAKETNIPSVFRFGDLSGKAFYVSYYEVSIYESRGPFGDEKWYMIAIIEAEVIDTYSTNLQLFIILALVISLIIGIVITALSTQYLVRPIVNQTAKLKVGLSGESLILQKVNINEVDEMIHTIQNLNANILDKERRLYNTIDLLKMPIIAFEVNSLENTFIASRDISSFIKIDGRPKSTVQDFMDMIEDLEPYLIREDEFVKTYKYLDIDQNYRWVDFRFIGYDTSGVTSGVIVDVTEECLEKEKILYERDYDVLTNIFNRRAFLNHLYKLFQSPENLKSAGMLMMDLDNLKNINDSYGHDFGDYYIQTLGRIIHNFCLDNNQCLYGRRSGDEFYVFYYGYESTNQIEIVMKNLLSAISHEWLTAPNGKKIRIRISAGSSMYPEDALIPDELLKFADYAMYEAKNSYKGELKQFDRISYNRNSFILNNQEELDILIENELIDFHFQPIVSLHDGSILGYESLMRSLSPVFRGPDEILRVAKANSKLYRIERLTIFKTMEKYQKYRNLFDDKFVFINSIPGQLLSDADVSYFEKRFDNILSKMVIEFTESERDSLQTQRIKLETIRRWNIKVAIDNYGAGYNREITLLEMPSDFIKVDMSLIRNIHLDGDRQRMVNSIVALTHEKGIKLVAEGVETLDELEYIASIGFDYFQGFYAARPSALPQPIPSEVVEEILNLKKKHSK